MALILSIVLMTLKITKKPSFVVGIDPSSKSAAYVSEEFMAKIQFAETSGPEACCKARRETVLILDAVKKDFDKKYLPVVYLEAPIVGIGGVKTTLVQAYVSGAIQAACFDVGFDVVLISNTKWKKKIVGSGKATKDEIKSFVKKHHKNVYKSIQDDQDMIDAFCIWKYGVENEKRLRRL